MSKIRLHGSSSGYMEIAPPAAASSATVTLPNSAGEILLSDGSAASLTQIPAANLVGVCTSGLTKTGGFGKLVQVVQTVKKDVFSTTVTPGTVSGDITGLTLSITPTSASNKILIDCHVNGGFVGSTGMYVYLYKDGSVLSDATGDDGGGTTVRASFQSQGGTLLDLEDVHGQYLDTAGGTSAITYSVRIQHPYTESSFAGTLYINRTGDADETKTNYVFPRTISTITAMEIAA